MTDVGDDETAVIRMMCESLRRMPRATGLSLPELCVSFYDGCRRRPDYRYRNNVSAFATDAERRQDCRSQHDVSGFQTDAKRQDCRSQHDVSGFHTDAEGVETAVIRPMCQPLRWMLQVTRPKLSRSCDIFSDGC